MARENVSLFPKFPRDITREQYLRHVFAEPRTFIHRKQTFAYVPIKSDEDQPIIVGKIGREYEAQVDAPPEEKFAPSSVMGWKSAFLIIDPTDPPRGDGQRVAFQVVNEVGKPFAVLLSFVSAINLEERSPFYVEAQPLPHVEHFRAWLQDRELETIKLTYVAPNGWFGTKNSVRTGLKRLREETSAETVTVSLTSKDGPLNAESDTIVESTEYIGTAGGEIWARDKNGKTFNSKKNQSSTRMEVEIDDAEPEESLLIQLLKNIVPIMKRD